LRDMPEFEGMSDICGIALGRARKRIPQRVPADPGEACLK